ncbi:MAG TPA: protein kinase [Nitrospiria bacterium]|nr:protein kinase [Nitrospiria bacterium]
MTQPLLQAIDQDQIKPYLDRLKDMLAVAEETIHNFDTATILGLIAALVVMIVVARMLQRLFSGTSRAGDSGSSETGAILKDAKRARRENNPVRAGELYELAGEVDEAIQMYREGQSFGPLARLYERQKNWALAGGAYEMSRDYERAGTMYQRAGNYNKAAEVLLAGNKEFMAAEIFEKARNFGEAARLYEKTGYFQKAASCYERSQAYGKAADLLEKLYLQENIRMKTTMPTADQRQIVNSYAQHSGRLFVKAGDPVKAAQILSLGGYSADAAEAYLSVKDYQKAADLYYQGKNYLKAAELYKQMGNAKKAHLISAEMYLDERNYLEAARMFEKAEDFLQAGDLYEKAGEMKKAGEMLIKGGDFGRANEIFQSSGDTLLAAQALEKAKRYKEAARLYLQSGAYEVAARLLDESGDYYEAGMIFHKLGRMENTVAFLQKVDTQSEHYYAASLALGQIFMDRGMLDAARERYKKLINKKEIGPDNLDPYYNLALVYEKNREYQNALLLFEKVMAENYNYKDVRNHVDLAREALRREQSAAESRKAADASGPKGRYKLSKKLGQGGMGVVYLAEDTVLNRIVAYKVLPPSVRDNPKVLENFLQEARVAAAINHPNIVTIYDTGSEGVEPYIVMEFVDGITLKELLEKSPSIPTKDLVAIAKQICQGLEYAHNKNVIHRDIKPANVMINKEHTVKIMDFGLAKILSESEMEGTSVKGTPLYMSPEQIQGKRVDHRTDIYSLGCTLYRMATGRPPFIEGDVYYHHLHTPPTPPRALNPKIPEALNQIILKCLSKDADQRYQRAKEIAADLEAKVR